MKNLDQFRRQAVAVAFAVAAVAGCQDESQILRGRVDATDFRAPVVGVRATRDGSEIAAAAVDGRGHFEIAVPPGRGYRLEVVTRDGAHPFVQRSDAAIASQTFDVCGSVAPFDMGHVHGADRTGGGQPDASGDCDMPDQPPCDPREMGDCEPPPPPSPCWCEPPPPPPCDPGDPYCNCPMPDPDGRCGEPPPPVPCDDPPPAPEPCDDPAGCPRPCEDDPMGCPPDPTCDERGTCCDADGNCCDADGNCCSADGTCCYPDGTCCFPDGTCAGGGDPCLPGPDGTCTDPCRDGMCDPPQDCEVWVCDPCAADPMSCWPDDPTCPMDEPGCWPDQDPGCTDPGTGMDCLRTGAVPQRPFARFGCGE